MDLKIKIKTSNIEIFISYAGNILRSVYLFVFILLFFFSLLIRLPQRPRLNLFGSPSKFDRDQDNHYYYDDHYGVYDDEDDYDEDEDEEAAESDRLIHELFLKCEKARWAKLGRKVPDNFVNPFEIDD